MSVEALPPCPAPTATISPFGWMRSDGSFDAGFGAGGVASTQVQDNDSAAVLLTQPDGKIFAIGSAQNSTGAVGVLLIRYLAS